MISFWILAICLETFDIFQFDLGPKGRQRGETIWPCVDDVGRPLFPQLPQFIGQGWAHDARGSISLIEIATIILIIIFV